MTGRGGVRTGYRLAHLGQRVVQHTAPATGGTMGVPSKGNKEHCAHYLTRDTDRGLSMTSTSTNRYSQSESHYMFQCKLLNFTS